METEDVEKVVKVMWPLTGVPCCGEEVLTAIGKVIRELSSIEPLLTMLKDYGLILIVTTKMESTNVK